MIAKRQDPLVDLFNEPAMFAAWERVATRSGAPGYDNVSVEDFSRNPGQRLRALRRDILSDRYRPTPLVRFTRKKPDGRFRFLNIAAVQDRVVCRVLADAMVKHNNSQLQPQSYAYRPGKGALKAVGAVQKGCREYLWAVRVDITEFFESMDHRILRETLAAWGWEAPVIHLIHQLVASPRFDGIRRQTPDIGVPLGLPLAPVLSNLYLDGLDAALNREQRAFVRYADDIVLFCGDADDAASALARTGGLLREVKLEVSVDKTRVYRIRDGFLFLGFLFRPEGHVAGADARKRLQDKLEDVACADDTPKECERRRSAISRGWRNYYAPGCSENACPDSLHDETPSIASSRVEAVEANPVAETQPPAHEDVTSALETARSLLAAGRHDQCVYHLRRVLSADPQTGSQTDQQRCRQLLSHAYHAMGLRGAARRCLTDGAASHFERAPTDKNEGSDQTPFSARHIAEWIEIFGGGNGRLAQQFVDRLGRNGYRPYSEKLTPKTLEQHWNGRRTLAASVHLDDKHVRFGALDLDITRSVNDRIRPEEREQLLERLLDDARSLMALAERAGVKLLLEASGHKGFHLWCLMHQPVEAALVRNFFAALEIMGGSPPEGTHRERFPAADRRPPEAIGRYMKLPLGFHRLTENRSRFLAPDGNPCANGTELLGTAFRNRARQLRMATENWMRYRRPASDATGSPQMPQPDNPAALAATHCAVLRGLRTKAQQEHRLNHAERIVLRGVLGALGSDGAEAIHGILKNCDNYNFALTRQALGQAADKRKPMGCDRIREVLDGFCAQVGCDCRFKARKNDYAHPLRWLDKSAKPPPSPTETGFGESGRTSPPRNAFEPSAPGENPETNPPASIHEVAALLTAVREARDAMLKAQANLVAAMNDRSEMDLPFGRLRRQGPDHRIMIWNIEC
jgi:group II intron reverse transcriptase/maturase